MEKRKKMTSTARKERERESVIAKKEEWGMVTGMDGG